MNKIINFHDVHDALWFDNIIKILRSKYDLVSIEDIEQFYYNEKKLKNACHITIDDGEASFYNVIYPVLKKHNVPATLFVSPKICKQRENFWFQEIAGYDQANFKKVIAAYLNTDYNQISSYPVGMILKNLRIDQIWSIISQYQENFKVSTKDPQNMTIDQLIEVDRDGLVAIGAHTIDHPILANESNEDSDEEICTSVTQLQDLLQHQIKYFAYPNGIPQLDFGQREINSLKKMNCRLSFSTQHKNFSLADNPFSIPRSGFSHGNQLFVKAKLLFGENWEKIKNLKSKGEKELRNEVKAKISSNRGTALA